eukprot:scpid34776/ scgid11551/ Superoxide dismutase [Cu-Zn]
MCTVPPSSSWCRFATSTSFLIGLVLIGISTLVQGQDVQLAAMFNSGGVSGQIVFQQASPVSSVIITVSLTGLSSTGTQSLPWHVHQFPIDVDLPPSQRCSAASVGGHFDPDGRAGTNYTQRCTSDPALCEVGDLSGRHGGLSNAVFNDSTLALSRSARSIAGRSVVIHHANGSRWVCASIGYSAARVTTAIARLQGTLRGTVVFRQAAGSNDTTVLMRLYQSQLLGALSYHVHAKPVRSNTDQTVVRCNATGGLFDPFGMASAANYSALCAAQRNACQVGDLSRKHGTIPASQNFTTLFFTDTYLPLSGVNTIVRRSIVFHNSSSDRVVCSNIQELRSRRATAVFDYGGVRGRVELNQQSPWDNTIVSVQLNGLMMMAGGYHIHEWPVPWLDLLSTLPPLSTRFCGSQAVGGHYNPFSASTPLPPGLTQDFYEVGDLSAKFGGLAGLNSLNATYSDTYITLFGPYSVVGRSIVLHNDIASSPRWQCATILLESTTLSVARAYFTGSVVGSIWFIQDESSKPSDTTVFSDLRLISGNSTATSHNWHVHSSPLGADGLATTLRCASAGGHFNPHNVDLSPALYQCSLSNQLLCEVGDLVGKSSQLMLSTGASAKHFYTDVDLPVAANGILGKSVVIHGTLYGGRLACADISRFAVQRGVADFGTKGRIDFSQIGPFSPTQLAVNVANLAGMAGGYHIHQLPVFSHCASTGGHFNPLQTIYSGGVVPVGGTLDAYEAGDLSGKFGSLSGLASLDRVYSDLRFVPLLGKLSSIGRSVVVHFPNGSRWFCANIGAPSSANTTTLTATISSSFVTGTVTLSQIPSNPALTFVTLDLQLVAGTGGSTRRKRQTTSSAPYTWLLTSSPPSASCNGIAIDPSGAAQASDYAQRCSQSQPLLCSTGDLSGKLGNIMFSGSSSVLRQFSITENLPLSGSNSVASTTVVLADTNGNRACAQLQTPSTAPTTSATTSPTTAAPTTGNPSTAPPVTTPPTMQSSQGTTPGPSTQPTTVPNPSTQPTTTPSPSTQPVTTSGPSTQPVTTPSPST